MAARNHHDAAGRVLEGVGGGVGDVRAAALGKVAAARAANLTMAAYVAGMERELMLQIQMAASARRNSRD